MDTKAEQRLLCKQRMQLNVEPKVNAYRLTDTQHQKVNELLAKHHGFQDEEAAL